MKVIYIAGPYRASSEYGVKCNIDKAGAAALFVWKLGGVAICPHMNTAYFGGALGILDETWLKGDLEILKRCDAVFALPGWEKSSGARGEVELAIKLGLPVFLDDYKLVNFIEGRAVCDE